jgi:hypothetical protein
MAGEIQSDATKALADTSTEIQKLGTALEADAKNELTGFEASAKTFYEAHLPLFAGIAGLIIGALGMLVKVKLYGST